MKQVGAYSLKEERLVAERQQAVIRLLLTLVTCLVLLKFYSAQPPPGSEAASESPFPGPSNPYLSLDQLILIITVFVTYSLAMWVMVRFCPDRLALTTGLGTIVEFGLITYLFSTTLWTNIPFYLWYFFFVVSVASRYGWLYSILALSASIVTYTYVVSTSYQNFPSVAPLLGITGFLLVLAMMFGQISEKQLDYQARLVVVNDFRAELASLVSSRDIIDCLIERAQELLNAEQAFFLPAQRGADGSEAPGLLRSAGGNAIILSTFRESGGIWNVERILKEHRPLFSNSLSKHNPLPEGMAGKLGLRNLAAAPLMVRGASVGVIYAANRRDRRLTAADLDLLSLMATQSAPVVENSLLWERLNEAAASEERARIARDLHDNFLQTLAAIKLHLERCKILVTKDQDRAREGIDKIHQIATRGLAEVRYYLSELRATGPEPSRFQEAIRKFAEEAALRGGFEVVANIELPADRPLPAGLAMAGFQIVRELLNNAVSHSKAEHVRVDVQMTDGRLILTVEDDGVGFEVGRVHDDKTPQRHLGLVGIEERARQCQGGLDLISSPGKGTKAIASLSV